MRLVWTRQAESMLYEAVDWIAIERPESALAWLDAVLDQVGSLAHFPDRGRVVPEVERQEIREILVSPYRVVYHRDNEQVTILAVLHDRRLFDLEPTEE